MKGSNKMYSYQIQTTPKRSERIGNMIDYVHSVDPEICIERARYVTEAYKKNEHEPNLVRRAMTLENTLKNMSLFVLPGSLLVGNQASKPRSAPLFPEYAVDFLEEEIIKKEPVCPSKRPTDKYKVNQGDIEEFQAIFDWWKGKTIKEKIYAVWPQEARDAQDKINVINDYNYLHGGDGHFIPDYEWLMGHGLKKVISDTKEKLAEIDLSDVAASEKREYYQAAIICYQAVIDWSKRYAECVREEMEKENDEKRKEELAAIAERCEWVPENPPRTYAEALQFMAFVHISIQVESNGQGISLGRVDQVLYPYYEKDLENEEIDYEQALELMENFFILLYICDKFRSWPDTNFFRGKPMFQTMAIGGVDPETLQDSTNDISYVVLDAIANTRLSQPSHYVRWHKKTPERFKMKTAEVIRLGTGYPAISNDDLFVQTMSLTGYEPTDAYNYAPISCAETGTPGMRGGRTGAAWFSLAKIFEMTLYGGKDKISGVLLHENPEAKGLASFTSWDELWEAFLDQISYYVDLAAYMDNSIDYIWEKHLEDVLPSAFGCPQTTLARGKSVKKGGAKYDYTGNETIGLANVANSLYAIKKLVFDDQVITGSQLLHALQTNFSDESTEPSGPVIQQMCLKQPKYGNDIDEVDFLAKDVLEFVCKSFWDHKNTRYGRGPIGGTFQASTTTVSSNTPFGMSIGALPDGRQEGGPLADGNSPMRGSDVKGPTAAVNSSSKLKYMYLSEGSLYNLKLHPNDIS